MLVSPPACHSITLLGNEIYLAVVKVRPLIFLVHNSIFMEHISVYNIHYSLTTFKQLFRGFYLLGFISFQISLFIYDSFPFSVFSFVCLKKWLLADLAEDPEGPVDPFSQEHMWRDHPVLAPIFLDSQGINN